MRFLFVGFIALIALFSSGSQMVNAYEINNHADISQQALALSVLVQPRPTASKLAALGLRDVSVLDNKQRFPLDANLLPIPYCFGSERPEPFKVGTWSIPPQRRGSGIEQPDWSTAHSAGLTIAQLIRYGSCYEDEEVPDAKPVAHFYNPQNVGAGVDLGIGPSSLRWSLQPGAGTSKSGQNPYTWPDARNYQKSPCNVYSVTPAMSRLPRRYCVM